MTNYKLYVDHDLRYLPSFYWLPKLHKQPYGTRFIAASNTCSTKPLKMLVQVKISQVPQPISMIIHSISQLLTCFSNILNSTLT